MAARGFSPCRRRLFSWRRTGIARACPVCSPGFRFEVFSRKHGLRRKARCPAGGTGPSAERRGSTMAGSSRPFRRASQPSWRAVKPGEVDVHQAGCPARLAVPTRPLRIAEVSFQRRRKREKVEFPSRIEAPVEGNRAVFAGLRRLRSMRGGSMPGMMSGAKLPKEWALGRSVSLDDPEKP